MTPQHCATCGHPIESPDQQIETEQGPVHDTSTCLRPWWDSHQSKED